MKRSHMNYCKECHKGFKITENSLDYCDTCRIILDLDFNAGEDQDYETQPELVEIIRNRFSDYDIAVS